MIRYCPTCWAENAYETAVCAACGASFDETGKQFADRLIEAIGHPEPTRAVIAIEILGRLGEKRAVTPLLNRLARQPDSMDVTTATAVTLGQLGEAQAAPGLAAVLQDGQRPLPARLAAAEALLALGGPEANRALAEAAALPDLPRLLRRLLTTHPLNEPTN